MCTPLEVKFQSYFQKAVSVSRIRNGLLPRLILGKRHFLQGFPGVGENTIAFLAANVGRCTSDNISFYIGNHKRF